MSRTRSVRSFRASQREKPFTATRFERVFARPSPVLQPTGPRVIAGANPKPDRQQSFSRRQARTRQDPADSDHEDLSAGVEGARPGDLRRRPEQLLLHACDDPAVYFCDIASGEEARRIETTWSGNRGMTYPAHVEDALEGGVLAVSPDGKTLATSVNFRGGSFHLWDTATGKELSSVWPDPDNQIVVGATVFSPDSKALVVGSSYPTTIQVWDIATRKERQQFAGHLKLKDATGEEYDVPARLKITSMAMSPDGKTLASAASDKTIRLWDVATGKEHRRLVGDIAAQSCRLLGQPTARRWFPVATTARPWSGMSPALRTN
jgi:WD40 repeat protein